MGVGNIKPPPSKMPLRINAKNYFLTYAQAERIESKEHLLWFLRDKVPTPERWCIGEETHADGGRHFHVLLGYENRFDLTNERFFDYEGHHPNIQAARAPNQVLAYCTKEDREPLIHGWVRGEREEDIFTVVREEVAGGNNATEVIHAIMERTGTRGLRLYNQIANYVDRMMRTAAVQPPRRVYPDAFPAVDDILGIKIFDFSVGVGLPIEERNGKKSLWLYGGTRLGKTELACSLGNHWYMNGAWNIECYDDRANYGVLDDIEWDSLKRYYKGLLGCQTNVTVTDKYKKKSIIRGGKPVIILTNELPVFTVAEASWLEGNVVFHFINASLYE